MQDRGFSSFASNMIKLSAVNETKWSSLLVKNICILYIFRFQYLISGPEKLPGLSRNGPQDFNPEVFLECRSLFGNPHPVSN